MCLLSGSDAASAYLCLSSSLGSVLVRVASMSMSIPARIKGSRLSKAVKFIFASYSSCMQYSTPSRSPVLMTDTACHKWCVCMCVHVMNVRMYVHVCVCNVTFSMHIMSGMEWSVPPLAHQEWNGIEYDLTCTSQWNGIEYDLTRTSKWNGIEYDLTCTSQLVEWKAMLPEMHTRL